MSEGAPIDAAISAAPPARAAAGLARGPGWILRHERLCLAALLLVHAGLLVYAATRNSVTFDEYAHLPAGLAYWKYADFSVYNLSPPLLRAWAALPALLGGARIPPLGEWANLPPEAKHWAYAETFLRANYPDYQRLFVLARWGLVLLSCLGVWIVYRWARALYGGRAGLAACALYALCPNIAAHASLVTTDAGTAVALLAAAWLYWRFCRQPSWGRIGLAVLALGLAHLCKFTALLLWPALILMTVWFATIGPRVHRRALGVGLAGALLGTLLLINAAYGFKGSGTALGSYLFRSNAVKSWAALLPSNTPVPLPRDFVNGFDVQKLEAEGLYEGYLFGEVYRGAKWYFYPAALACKLPLSVLALLALALAGSWRSRAAPVSWRLGSAPLLIVLAVFVLGMTVLAQINIGVLYLLPMFPPAFILLGGLWAPPRTERPGRPWRMYAATVLLAGLAVEHAAIAPRYLAFINVAAGGPTHGYRLLSDSNFDWGQSLIDLKAWMDRNRVPALALGYFGTVDPGVYGIKYSPLFDPRDEPYVGISSYFLVGLAHRMPTPQGRSQFIDVPFHRELAQRHPVATVGYTIFIYTRADFDAARDEYFRRAQQR